MALFYPGLKVKCVRGTYNIGCTAVVVSTLPVHKLAAIAGLTLSVRWDQAVLLQNLNGEKRTWPAGSESIEPPDNFEPIIPEGELHEQEYEVVEELEA